MGIPFTSSYQINLRIYLEFFQLFYRKTFRSFSRVLFLGSSWGCFQHIILGVRSSSPRYSFGFFFQYSFPLKISSEIPFWIFLRLRCSWFYPIFWEIVQAILWCVSPKVSPGALSKIVEEFSPEIPSETLQGCALEIFFRISSEITSEISYKNRHKFLQKFLKIFLQKVFFGIISRNPPEVADEFFDEFLQRCFPQLPQELFQEFLQSPEITSEIAARIIVQDSFQNSFENFF